LKKSFLFPASPLLLIALLSGLDGFSQDNIIKRSYHDVTARDNAYFNANLKIRETQKKLFDGQKDNYEVLLPVFKYGKPEDAKGVAADMDDVIKRSSFPIQLHKNSKWVDDAYFLVGKAYFYKQEYDKALESFQYLISEYDDIDKAPSKSSKKKKKKKSKKPSANDNLPSQDQSFAWLKHHKKSPLASLWITRTLIEMGRYSDAQTALSVIRGNEDFPNALLGELEAVQAHLWLKQNKFENAIESLKLTVENTKPKADRIRYSFILAQLYSKTGRISEAVAQYESVLDMKPNYEMEFFTQISMANLLRDNKLKSGDEIKRMLAALLKDQKNKDYFGLIYYAIADIELEQKNREAGMENLNLSVRNAGPDNKQKALSYLRMADIHYEEDAFRPAFYYYDSSLVTLDEQYVRYREAKDRRDGLSGLVEYLKTIDTEDRLRYWASLPEKARVAEIEEWLEETRGPEEDEEDTYVDPSVPGRSGSTTGSVVGNGKWYFYDEARKGRGFSEFRKIWGKRVLEDSWRRSDKRSTAPETDESNGDPGNVADGGPVDLDDTDLTLDELLAVLPLDSAGKAASDQRLIESHYNVANIYKEYLDNNAQAIQYFQKLLKDFPQNEYRLQTAYNLYLLLAPPANEAYKKIVLEEFPESVFASIIQDPQYFEKLARKDDAVKEYYAATFNLYEQEAYADVLGRIASANEQFPENPIKPHFALLGAMVFGATDSVEAFKIALQDVVNTYPGTEQAVRAQELLNHLRLGSVIQRAEEAATTESDYALDPGTEHFVALVLYEVGREAAAMKTKVSDFNREFFSLENLRVSSLLFESDKTIILVKTFSNLDKAMKYYRDLKPDEKVFEGLEPAAYKIIAVSRNNYTALYRKKDLDGYVEFFEKFYLTDN